ncbi:ORF1a polyprotein [RtClon arterivirus]|uniref:ORF1a polyprotein n=1 Tax=RtClon arterivirus TaxID=2847272 RepID=A0A1L6Z3Q7_9NIDO|nr:ORF1a polyprotein [Rat arterivirus 1]APT40620.1 ORF1a polyprotein [RtClon arterivirus]
MSGMFDRCVCTPNARVFMAEGQVYCTRCLAARPLLSLQKQDKNLGVLGLFYAPKEPLSWTCPQGYPTPECSPAGCCWLSAIFPIARMTSGNGNFFQRLERVAQVIYAEGALTPRALDHLYVYDRGCKWYPITGPVPGVAVFANSMHVSDRPFPGATHVLTNLPLPQRPKAQPFCPFERANANVWAWGDYVVYETEGKWSWARRGDCSVQFDPVPKEHRLAVYHLIENFPEHHIVTLANYTFDHSGVSYRPDRHEGHLRPGSVPDGLCWRHVFGSLDAKKQAAEIRTAVQFGYQTKHGVPGKYIQRRLQVNGLRAVIDRDGPIAVEAFSTATSWIRHLNVSSPTTPDFVEICRIRVEPNTAPLESSDEKIFRFGQHKWYGAGKKQRAKRAAKEEKEMSPPPLTARQLADAKKTEIIGQRLHARLNAYSPPGDGNCGWHCLSAVANRMISNVFESSLPTRFRDSHDWASDDDLVSVISAAGLPVGLNRCGYCCDAKYVLHLTDDHWTVTCNPGVAPKQLPLACIHGVCQHVGRQVGGSPPPVDKIHPGFNSMLESLMSLPSSAIALGMQELLAVPADTESARSVRRSDVSMMLPNNIDLQLPAVPGEQVSALDLSRSDVGTPTDSVRETWTVSQALARLDTNDAKKFCDIRDLLVGLFAASGVTQQEVDDAINASIASCSNLSECCAVLEKSLCRTAVTKSKCDLTAYFPEYRPANPCRAVVPVKPVKTVTKETGWTPHGLDVRPQQVSVPLSAETVMNFTYPGCADAHYAITGVCRRISLGIREKYGFGKRHPTDPWYPDTPQDLTDLIDKAEEDFTQMAGAQLSLENMIWFCQEFDVERHVASYTWTPCDAPPEVPPDSQVQRRRHTVDAPTGSVAVVAAPAVEVPDSWEDLCDGGASQPLPLDFTLGTLSSVSAEPVQCEPLDLSTSGSVKFGPPASQCAGITSADLGPLAPPECGSVLDLSGSSTTVFDLTQRNESPTPSSPASSASSAVLPVERPPKSAQALIDAQGDMCRTLTEIKFRARNMCLAACDPTRLTDPATEAWVNCMWDRLDLLTWKNKSKYQAAFQLGDLSMLPGMILETPPPYPCPVMLPLGSPPRSATPESDVTLRTLSEHPPCPPGACTEKDASAPALADSEDSPPPAPAGSDPVPPPGDSQAPSRSTFCGGIFASAASTAAGLCDGFSRQVFAVASHLPAFFARAFHSGGGYTSGDWCFAAFVLCCLLLCYSYPPVGCAPLLGVFSGSGRRVRIGVFGVWLAFAIILFRPTPDPIAAACDSDSPDCRRVLLDFERQQPWDPVRSLVVGPLGLGTAILGRLLGGARYFWFVLLRLCFLGDLLLAGAYIVSQGRCKRCWGRCVRMAPSEIPLNVFPFTRATRTSLVDLCNRYCAPKGIDPIFVASGWRGCYSGDSPIEQPSSTPISYVNLDEKKISSRTVVSPPYDPSQAIKCLKVLQAGGAMAACRVPAVVKLTQVPFLAPFLPKLPVNPDARIVVDSETFTCALRSGYDTSNFILGEGNFAELNGLKIQQLQRPKGGFTYGMASLHAVVWVVAHMILGIYVTRPSQCGTGTSDPWCSDPFSVPVFGSGTLCTSNLCISPSGLTLPLATALRDFGAREASIVGLVLLAVACVAHRLAVKADALAVLFSLVAYVYPLASWALACFPVLMRWLPLHPFTALWVHFFLVACNPPAGGLALAFSFTCWILGRYTQVAGLVTPYDIHSHTSGPRGAAAILTAPEGTYLAAVRRAALTGKTIMFCPSGVGSLLEGAFRTSKPCLNTVNVVGSSMGSGGVFTYQGKKVCVTATHVLSGNTARVTGPGYNRLLEFTTNGDFAYADVPDWVGPAPEAKAAPPTWCGRAFWLTASGVEPGVIGDGYAFCFTACGDSGSPVLTEGGDLVGIHTGSNKQGGGLVTRPDGQTCSIRGVKLSELSKHFAGPHVPLGDLKLGPHIETDVSTLPADLCALLSAKPTLEGGLSTVQLLCVFFLLWRMMGYAYTPFIAVGFFCLNEVLPAVLVRSCFSFGMFVLAWLTPWSAQVLMIRLLTAALNRNRWSLLFYSTGAIVGFVSDFATTKGYFLGQVLSFSTYCFAPRALVMTSVSPVVIVGLAHFMAVVLWLFKYRTLHNLLVGDGVFSAAFFLRYFAEGKLRDGVSASCGFNCESLTGALACKLSDDDLSFLTRLTDFKCFVSASNMRNAANQYIEAAYAKALRLELSQLVQVEKMKGVLARLDAFASTTVPSVTVGDVVVVLGSTPVGQVFELMVGSTKHAIQSIETRVLAGTKFTVGRVVDPKPAPALRSVPVPVPTSHLEWGPASDDRVLKGKKSRKYEKISDHVIDGRKYEKWWDKASGDVFYRSSHDDDCHQTIIGGNGMVTRVGYEGCAPMDAPDLSKCKLIKIKDIDGRRYQHWYDPQTKVTWLIECEGRPAVTDYSTALEAARLNVDQALTSMGAGQELTAAEVEKLKRIIDQLQSLTKEQCLNC